MRSMTGYGRAIVCLESVQAVLEATSVNRKNLDLSISLPKEWQRLEPEIAELVRSRIQRGRLNFSISLEIPESESGAVFDRLAVESGLRELKTICHRLEIPFEPDARLVFEIATSGRGKTVLPEAEKVSARVLEAAGNALDELLKM